MSAQQIFGQGVFSTANGQTVTVVSTPTGVTVRVAKDGHNRAVAKLDDATAYALAEALRAAVSR